MALIEYPSTWDAVQIVNTAMQQIWDEHCAVLTIDPEKIVVPESVCSDIFNSYGHKLLCRIEKRIVDQDWS